MNSAWRALLDNMAVSYAPQVIMKRTIEPADGNSVLQGRKIWWAPKDEPDVQKAFYVFNVNSNQKELMAIIELAMKFADDETSLPQLAQGEQGTAPDTVGGMTILMNAANAMLKRLVKQFDDMITRPHIRRYYDWNMQYNEDESIKGDFEVDARGSTALMVRDQQKQSIVNLMQMARTPEFGPYIDKEKLFRKALETEHFTPTDIMASDAEIAAAKEEAKKAASVPPLPIAVAQIRAKAEVDKVKIDTDSEVVNEKLRQEAAQRDRDHDLEMTRLQRDLKILELSAKTGMNLDTIKAKLADTVIKTNAQHAAAERSAAAQASRGNKQPQPA